MGNSVLFDPLPVLKKVRDAFLVTDTDSVQVKLDEHAPVMRPPISCAKDVILSREALLSHWLTIF